MILNDLMNNQSSWTYVIFKRSFLVNSVEKKNYKFLLSEMKAWLFLDSSQAKG